MMEGELDLRTRKKFFPKKIKKFSNPFPVLHGLSCFSYLKEAMKDTQNWIEGRMMYVGSLKR